MASNSFGTLFRYTTWGESHGPSIGCVIDGCPAGLPLASEDIQKFLDLRLPGKSNYVSPRQEVDKVQILSGVFEGKTTGAPISLLIPNQDSKPEHYEAQKHLLKPGHANFTYLKKYGIFDWRGGGRASARETACRVACGAVADKILTLFGIDVVAHLKSMGSLVAAISHSKISFSSVIQSPIFCLDSNVEHAMTQELERLLDSGDSIGGCVEIIAYGCPVGLGDPVYEKLDAKLAFAMMSIPASKGFEIGEGISAASMRGSEHNDCFVCEKTITTETNHAGGVLGGISTGQPLICRVFFKPTSSIRKQQKTVTVDGKTATIRQPERSRHDPCVAIRAVPVCQAMAKIVIADTLLMSCGNSLTHGIDVKKLLDTKAMV